MLSSTGAPASLTALPLTRIMNRVASSPRSRIAGSAPAPQRVQAPRPGAGGREVEQDEAVERGRDPAVDGGPEALGEMELEVRHRHLAGEDEGDGAGEEAEQEQPAADHLEPRTETELREPRHSAAGGRAAGGEREELRRPR